MQDRKTTIKMADNVQQALIKQHGQRYPQIFEQLQNFVNKFQELGIESGKFGKALAHNWHMAAETCCTRTNRLLCDISYSVASLSRLTEKPHKEAPKLHLLVEELDQLQEEFGDIDFDKAANTISVVTESITLEDIYLGPFKIQLELNNLGEHKDSPYYCVALNPNPAGTDESVTHPHVSNDQLCEGDGSEAITASLEQGRLCDFFTMVRSILSTYNPDSPYVSLDEWSGIPCYDCGCSVTSEDTYYCEHCDRDYCSECSTYCRSCDTAICLGCSTQCPYCEETICSGCTTLCPHCEEECCELCLEKCPSCEERVCSSCTTPCPHCEKDCCELCLEECSECETRYCRGCLEDGLCPSCKEQKGTEENEKQQDKKQQKNQAETNKQNENEIQPQTTTTALVKLAS